MASTWKRRNTVILVCLQMASLPLLMPFSASASDARVDLSNPFSPLLEWYMKNEISPLMGGGIKATAYFTCRPSSLEYVRVAVVIDYGLRVPFREGRHDDWHLGFAKTSGVIFEVQEKKSKAEILELLAMPNAQSASAHIVRSYSPRHISDDATELYLESFIRFRDFHDVLTAKQLQIIYRNPADGRWRSALSAPVNIDRQVRQFMTECMKGPPR